MGRVAELESFVFLKAISLTHAIAITAHHDDAVLWCGGTIIRTLRAGWRWTVIALCVPDPQRQVYFDSYCAATGVAGRRFTFRDYQSGATFSENNRDQLISTVQEILAESSFNYIFTHSKDQGGEYGGHTNHDEVRLVTEQLVTNANQLAHFCYNPEFGYNGRATTARLDSDFHVQLSYDELIQKAGWCRKAPDCMSSLKAIGFPCPNPEGFRAMQLPSGLFIPR